MTNEELVKLLPKLTVMAKTLKHNGCSYEDLVQDAALCFLTTKSKFRYPLIFARSRMIDYCRKHGDSKFSKRYFYKHPVEVLETKTTKEVFENIDWKEFNLTKQEEDIAISICDNDLTQAETAKVVGLPASTVSHRWLHIKEKIKRKWKLNEYI